MSEMLPEEEPVQSSKRMSEALPDGGTLRSPLADRWVNIEPAQPSIEERWVDIVQVAPAQVIESKVEPVVTPRGVVLVISGFTLTLAIVLFVGMIYERPASRRNARWAG